MIGENNNIESGDNEPDQDQEVYPVEPRYHPIHMIPRKIYDTLASARLAMFLLFAILISCLAGTTIYRGEEAGSVIFSSLWFNFLLVLLIVNVACCFFGRIWGRKITLVSFGMILFHLSFVSLFVGIVYNSLFYFRGSIRLTEGESLPLGDVQSYDYIDKGRFYGINKLKGDISLVKIHTGYTVAGKDKRVAYEVSIGSGPQVKQEIIFVTKHLYYRGYKYFPDKEGYSALTIISNSSGKELYGAYLPLQSLKQKDGTYLYTIGTKDGAGTVMLPPLPEPSLLNLNVSYKPDANKEKSGEVFFQIYPIYPSKSGDLADSPIEGKAVVGSSFDSGKHSLSVKEIRYWAAMAVRYEPGQPIILTSLWVGLFGMILTTFARIFRKKKFESP